MNHDYTEEDLRIEAARQHNNLTTDHVYSVVGEEMEGSPVPSLTSDESTTHWDDLSPYDFDSAERGIDDLLSSAANTSAWAVEMGADEMNPSPHSLDIRSRSGPLYGRVHLAIHPSMPDSLHRKLLHDIGKIINENTLEQWDL